MVYSYLHYTFFADFLFCTINKPLKQDPPFPGDRFACRALPCRKETCPPDSRLYNMPRLG